MTDRNTGAPSPVGRVPDSRRSDVPGLQQR